MLASRLARVPVKPDDSQCAACNKLEPWRRQSVNYVVVSISANAAGQRGGQSASKRVINANAGAWDPVRGVGTELEKLISTYLRLPMPTAGDCHCQDIKQQLNRCGPDWAMNALGYLVDQLQANHARVDTRIPFSRVIAAAAVKIACRRANKLPPLEAPN